MQAAFLRLVNSNKLVAVVAGEKGVVILIKNNSMKSDQTRN
jgi:hypothetical protein